MKTLLIVLRLVAVLLLLAGVTLLGFRIARADAAPPTGRDETGPLVFMTRMPSRRIILPRPAGHPLVAVLKEAGFQGDRLRTAYAVMKAESGGRPTAFNGNQKSG